MGVLSRRRSLLIKLIVVVTTAWFTIAFLLYSENRTDTAIAVPLENNEVNREPPVAEERVAVPFKELEEEVVKKPADNAVLLPPQDAPGEMGKPVVLPTNLTGTNLLTINTSFRHFLICIQEITFITRINK